MNVVQAPVDILRNMFRDVFCTDSVDQTKIEQYFHPDYKQIVNGLDAMDRDQFVEHLRALKQVVKHISIEIDKAVQSPDGSAASTLHVSSGVKSDTVVVRARVIAFWEFDQTGRITRCEEATHLLSGDATDADLGSRH
jgi:hypothetical protein